MCKFEDGKKCKILTAKACIGCRFALTQEQADKKQIKIYERCRNLPIQTQRYIADKYYGGVMVWQE